VAQEEWYLRLGCLALEGVNLLLVQWLGLGGMAAMRGRSSGANGLQGKSSGGMTGM